MANELGVARHGESRSIARGRWTAGKLPVSWARGVFFAIVIGVWLSGAEAQPPVANNRAAVQYGQSGDANSPLGVDDLQVDIVAPDKADAGMLVKLVAVAPGSQSLTWLLSGHSTELWSASETGQLCFFATPRPGKYTFALVAASVVDGKAVQVTAEHTVEIFGSEPAPNPGPAPGPAPSPSDPTFPKGTYGLAEDCYRAVIPLINDGGDKSKRLGEILRGISANYVSIKSQAAAGVITDPNVGSAKIRDRNRETAGDDLKLITEAMLRVRACIDKAASAENPPLKTIQQYQVAWQEIADGIGAAGWRAPQ